MIRVFSLAIVMSICAPGQRASGIIETIAGTDGIGRPALSFGIGFPTNSFHIATDAAGNIYFSRDNINRVYRVGTEGIVHIAAGNGSGDSVQQGGIAALSPMPFPTGLATDASGALFIASGGGVARVDPTSGKISTVLNQNSGVTDFALFSNGDLCVLESDYFIKRINRASGIVTVVAGNGTSSPISIGSNATQTGIGNAASIAVGPDDTVYFVANGQQKIFRVSATGTLGVLADTTSLGYYLLEVRVDSTGNPVTLCGIGTYAAIVRFDRNSGTPSILLAPQQETSIGWPFSIAVESSGNVLLYDAAFDRGSIYRVDAVRGTLSAVVGDGHRCYDGDGIIATQEQLCEPTSMLRTADGSIFLTSTAANLVLKVDTDGLVYKAAGGGSRSSTSQPVPASQLALMHPQGLLLDADGDLYFSDLEDSVVRRLAASGGMVSTFANTQPNILPVSAIPGAGALAGDSQYLYMSDPLRRTVWRIKRADGTVQRYAGTGKYGFGGDGGPAASTDLPGAAGLALDSSGNLFIADQFVAIRRVDAVAGVITTVLGGVQASGLAFAPDGRLCFTAFNKVQCLDLQSGKVATIAGTGVRGFGGDGGPPLEAQLNTPSSIAFDETGSLYIVDRENQRVRVVRGLWGTPRMHIPHR